MPKRRSDERLLSDIERNQSALSLAESASKPGRARKLTRRVDRLTGRAEGRGLDLSGLAPDDFSEGVIDNQAFLSAARSGGFRPGASSARIRESGVVLNRQNREEQTRERFETRTEPRLDRIGSELEGLLDQDLVSAAERAAFKSRTVAAVRSQEASRLERMGAIFGTRQFDAGSPVGAAMANRVAQEADTRITQVLSDYDLTLAQLEQDSKQRELGLLSQFTGMDVAIREAALSGDFDKLMESIQGLSTLEEAIRQSNLLNTIAVKTASGELRAAETAAAKQARVDLIASRDEGISGAAGAVASFI